MMDCFLIHPAKKTSSDRYVPRETSANSRVVNWPPRLTLCFLLKMLSDALDRLKFAAKNPHFFSRPTSQTISSQDKLVVIVMSFELFDAVRSSVIAEVALRVPQPRGTDVEIASLRP